jgi:hypothetical protein
MTKLPLIRVEATATDWLDQQLERLEVHLD